jgi:sugar lactone lactonase YvrE
LSAEKTVDFLKTNYVDQGKLGNKSSLGGLYPPVEESVTTKASSTDPEILVLDVGLSAPTPDMKSGQILKITADGKHQQVVLKDQSLPDGLAVDPASGRMFWTCMGVPGKSDGAVYSANVDGTDIITVVAPGVVNTPKQLSLDHVAQMVYFCDREGCRVYRCAFDGSNLEVLVDNITHDLTSEESVMDWCVGVAVSPALGKFYWTQKGTSKGGKGRIFCGKTTTPSDAHCILDGLPEPIDIEVNEESHTLYWTDRGELPWGNSLNRISLDEGGLPILADSPMKHEIITRGLNEAIGLKLDTVNSNIYLTDLGGSIYRCDLDGKNKEKIYTEDHRAFTGIALL